MTALNQETIEELRSLGGDELVSEIVDAFLSEATADVDALRAAADASDAEALERVAHRFKSASAVVGALHVSEFAARLQTLGRSGSAEGAREIVQELEAAWQAAFAELTPLRTAA